MVATIRPAWAERLLRNGGYLDEMLGYVNLAAPRQDVENLLAGYQVEAHTSDGHVVVLSRPTHTGWRTYHVMADCPRCVEVLSA